MTRDNRSALLAPAVIGQADAAGVAHRLAMVTAERRRMALMDGAPSWPVNQWANYWPAPLPEALVAVTVFVERIRKNAAGRFYQASCVCGGEFLNENRQHLRKEVSSHSCAAELGGPAPLLPLPAADVDEQLLGRVLDRLRAL